MEKIGNFIIKYRKYILAIFIGTIIVSGMLSQYVKVNYDLSQYLPNDNDSVVAYKLNQEEFGNSENIRVLIENIDKTELEQFALAISSVNGGDQVSSIVYYQDNQQSLASFYDEDTHTAIFHVTLKNGLNREEQSSAVVEIRNIVEKEGKTIAMQGLVVNNQYLDDMMGKEMKLILMLLIPIVLIVLLLTTKSYIEPFLCLIVVGVTIVITSGTNIIFENISFITQNMLAALTLAISMDYSIFLLHAYKDEKDKGLSTNESVVLTVKRSFTTVTASSLTTIAGFLALVIMRFTLGADMGWVFAKAILISVITVLLLMPVLILLFNKWIEKTYHKDLIPSFKRFSKGVVKIRYAIIPFIILLIIPAIYGSSHNNFVYGMSSMTETKGSSLYEENKLINDTFGKSNQVIMLIPNGTSLEKQKALVDDLMTIENVNRVTSLSSVASQAIQNPVFVAQLEGLGITDPNSIYTIPFDTASQLLEPVLLMQGSTLDAIQSDAYSRVIIDLGTKEEGEAAFTAIVAIKSVGNSHFEEDSYVLGGTSATYDIKEIVDIDYTWVTILSIVAVGIIILLAFKSLILPLVLLLVIEAGIFINMSIPYFMDQSLTFVGYLVISAIQLGATIDYAILLTHRYMESRKIMNKKEAAMAAVQSSSASILTSGTILTLSGLAINLISSNGIISQMGILIGRGAFISMMLVFIFLPALLVVSDRLIERTTIKAEFYQE